MRKERKSLPLDGIALNEGQLDWLPRNPRSWTQSEIDKTAASIREDTDFLEDRPLLVTPNGDKFVVFAGNLRREGAAATKLTAIPAVVYYPETADDYATIKRRAMKDNGSFGSWDYDELANSWDDLPLADYGVPAWDAQEGGGGQPDVQEDNFDEETDAITVRCKPGDIWQLGEHRLMCGDCTDTGVVANLLGGNEADLLLTDPPYNVDYSSKNEFLNAADKGNHIQAPIQNDKMSDAEFASFLDGAFGAAEPVLKKGGAFYVWAPQGHAQIDIAAALDRAGLFFRQQIIWVKNNFVLGRMDYQGKHEPCFYGWKEGAGHFFRDTRSETTVIPDAEEIDIDKMKKDEMKELLKKMFSDAVPTTIIKENKPQRSDLHPTMKPVRLFGQLINNSTKPGEIVLDIFAGSGTTIIAAEQLGRKAYVVELDPHYCDAILARWEKLTGRKAVRVAPS